MILTLKMTLIPIADISYHQYKFGFEELCSRTMKFIIKISHSQLNGQEFSELSELEELHLSQNYLEKLPDGLFLHMKMLKKLFLFNNNLECLGSNMLEGLNNLSSLLVNNNLLRSIEGSTFSHVPNLLKL
jgi:Leucine-rich repeat (LRR) protein